MKKAKADKILFDETEREEELYLKNVRSTKPSQNCALYKLCKYNDGSGMTKQQGGFIQALLPILRVAGPFLLDYAINKFTGNGFVYKNKNGDELTNDEKKLILLNILVKYPHLKDNIFM